MLYLRTNFLKIHFLLNNVLTIWHFTTHFSMNLLTYFPMNVLNNRFLRERGMTSNLQMEYHGMHFSLAKLNWDNQQGRLFPYLPKGFFSFPSKFKPKVAIAKFVWKMQKSLVLWKVGLTPCLFSSLTIC